MEEEKLPSQTLYTQTKPEFEVQFERPRLYVRLASTIDGILVKHVKVVVSAKVGLEGKEFNDKMKALVMYSRDKDLVEEVKQEIIRLREEINVYWGRMYSIIEKLKELGEVVVLKPEEEDPE